MIPLNDYANSMFRYEFLNENWLKKCSAYLNFILKGRVKNKVVVDYAFGRGNWSVAFIRTGAKEVYAIDASKDNCIKFQAYCDRKGLKNIHIIHRNILKQEIGIKADLIWCYGIMYIFKKTDKVMFVKKIKQLAKDDKALFYFYEYNSGSLREFIVQTSRELFKYSSQKEFLIDSFKFIRSARMRVRDDLTAPYIFSYTHFELQKFYERHGLYPIKQNIDFQEFLGKKGEEFRPYQFLCSLSKSSRIKLKEQISPYEKERKILELTVKELGYAGLNKNLRRKIIIGLNNTYYAYLTENSFIENSILELFFFLMYVFAQNNIKIKNMIVKKYSELFFDALKGIERRKYYKILGRNIIIKYLVENTTRM